mmetsp:Transcript_107401/g.299216  ORF Transcript_107401/g.299216 Transcript_107401/m.299216 type:complete len:304 (-) Transcript_107401:187-1098(-)
MAPAKPCASTASGGSERTGCRDCEDHLRHASHLRASATRGWALGGGHGCKVARISPYRGPCACTHPHRPRGRQKGRLLSPLRCCPSLSASVSSLLSTARAALHRLPDRDPGRVLVGPRTAVELGHPAVLLRRQGEAEEVHVLQDAGLGRGLGQDHCPLLHAPPEQHLRRRPPDRGGDLQDDGVPQEARRVQRAEGLHRDAVPLAEPGGLPVDHVGVVLNLVHRGQDLGVAEQLLEVWHHVVGDAYVAALAPPMCGLQSPPGALALRDDLLVGCRATRRLEAEVRPRKVHEAQVHVGRVQLGQH